MSQSIYTKAETHMILCITRGTKCTPELCKNCGWLKNETKEYLKLYGDEPQWIKEE